MESSGWLIHVNTNENINVYIGRCTDD